MSKTKTIKVSESTHARLLACGTMSESFENVLVKLLGETWDLPKLKNTLTKATELNEKAKKHAGSPLSGTACDMLLRVLSDFIQEVEAR